MSPSLKGFARPPNDMLIDAHVEQRGRERYGVTPTTGDITEMVDQIRTGRGFFVARKPLSKRVKVFLVWWPTAGRIVPDYYKTPKIRSILPPYSTEVLINELLSSRWQVELETKETM